MYIIVIRLCKQKRQGILITILKVLLNREEMGWKQGYLKPTTSHILHSQHPPCFSWLSPLSPYFDCKILAFLHNFPLFFLLIHRESVCGGEWNSLAYVASFSLDIQHKINVALAQFLHNNSGVKNCYAGWKQSHLLHYYNHILNWIRTQYFLASYSIVACIKDINYIKEFY